MIDLVACIISDWIYSIYKEIYLQIFKELNKERKKCFYDTKSWSDFTWIVHFGSPISDLLDDRHYIKRGYSAWFMGVKDHFGFLILFGNDDFELSISFNW